MSLFPHLTYLNLSTESTISVGTFCLLSTTLPSPSSGINAEYGGIHKIVFVGGVGKGSSSSSNLPTAEAHFSLAVCPITSLTIFNIVSNHSESEKLSFFCKESICAFS
eukprot:TRINITY_DN3492_c0_g1_i1.p1 TRINITY_DN3492_c0_g1~~TRINITY_DN3492_c0_g1_i1.p1  ORF type:complete len:108 (+),score=17.71 TRINITY_DN3492_c0_g1_i1:480-803(+)